MKDSPVNDLKKFMSGEIAAEVRRRMDMLDDFRTTPGAEYDAFGASRESIAEVMNGVYFFYRFYFRTDVHGIENIAGLPRALITPNHMVQTPVDGMNIVSSLFFEPENPRLVRTIVHHVMAQNPFVSTLVYRSGQVIGSSANADRLFDTDNLVLIFPEGANAIRPYSRRYRLNRFSPGFMEYSIKHDYPIVPTAVIGSEESTMILAEIKSLKGFMGIPRFPITPTFPLLGIPGMIPYPAKFRIFFGEPMDFSGEKDALGNPGKIKLLVEEVRIRVQKMLEERLAELPKFPFF